MRNYINETLINSIKKSHYNNIMFKEKEKGTIIKMQKKSIYKDKLDTFQSLNLSPALSYAPEFRTIRTKNNLFNKIDIKNEKDVNETTYKFGFKSNSVYRGNKLKIANNKLSFSRISTNNTFESNNEVKNKKNLFGTIQPNANSNLFLEHKKIEFLNTLNDKKNKISTLDNDSFTNFENPNKYKTIFTKFTKFNSRIIKNKNVLEEPNYFFEIFSSKYNKKEERKEEIKEGKKEEKEEVKKEEVEKEEVKNEKKEVEKEEVKKEEVKEEKKKKNELKMIIKSGERKREKTKKLSLNAKITPQQYLKTETNINRFPLNRKTNNVNFPNYEHIISFNNLLKPIFYEDEKTQKLNLKLILKKINDKSFLRLVPISNHLLSNKIKERKNDISLDKLLPKKRCSYKKINGVKYSAINLNMLTQFPNRLEYINCPRYELNYFRKNKSSKMNKKKKVNSLKQSFNINNIKLLRKKFLSNYSNSSSLRKQKKNSDNKAKLTISKNNMNKTFYYFNDDEAIKKNIRIVSLKKKYIFSSRIIRKKNENKLKLKLSPKIDINFISI